MIILIIIILLLIWNSNQSISRKIDYYNAPTLEEKLRSLPEWQRESYRKAHDESLEMLREANRTQYKNYAYIAWGSFIVFFVIFGGLSFSIRLINGEHLELEFWPTFIWANFVSLPLLLLIPYYIGKKNSQREYPDLWQKHSNL